MSRTDPGISLGVKTPEVDNPLETYGKLLNLKNLMNQGKLQSLSLERGAADLQTTVLENQQKEREVKGNQALTQAIQANTRMTPPNPAANEPGGMTVDHDAVEAMLTRAGFPDKALAYNKDRTTIENSMLEHAEKQLSVQAEQAKQMSNLAQSVLNQPADLQPGLFGLALKQASQNGWLKPDQMQMPQIQKAYTSDPVSGKPALSPETKAWLQSVADNGAPNGPLDAMNKRIAEQRAAATSAAELPGKVADSAKKQTDLEAQTLGAATDQAGWDSALSQLSPDRKKLYSPQFSDSERKRAMAQGISPDTAATLARATNPEELVVKAAAGDAGAVKALKMLKDYNIDLEYGKAVATVKAQFGAFGGAGNEGPGSELPIGVPGQRNEQLLATLNPNIRALVKGVLDGKVTIPARSTYWNAIISEALRIDPSFDAINYNSRAKTRADFTSGKAADNVTAFNTAIEHAGRLDQAIDGLGNFDTPILNSVVNAGKRAVGTGGTQNVFNNDVQAFVSEATRAWRQAGGSEADIAAWKKNLSSSDSPAALHSSIKEMVELLMGKTRSLHQQYVQGMGTDTSDIPMVTPNAKKVLDKVGVEGLPQTATQPAPAPSDDKVITPDLMARARKANPGVADSAIIDALKKKGYRP